MRYLLTLHMGALVTSTNPLLYTHKDSTESFAWRPYCKEIQTERYWKPESVQWNGHFRSVRSNRKKWSTSKGGPLFPKNFRLDRTVPFSFGPKFPEILVEWKAPYGLKDPSQARLCYCFDLKLRSNYSSNVTKRLNSSTGKNINCSLKLKFLRLFLILVPVKGLSIIFSAFWRLFKKLELKECLCS